MKNFKDMKLGDEIQKKDLGQFEDLFDGKVRLLKITYSFQDENGLTADIGLEHKEFWKEDDDAKSEQNTKEVKA